MCGKISFAVLYQCYLLCNFQQYLACSVLAVLCLFFVVVFEKAQDVPSTTQNQSCLLAGQDFAVLFCLREEFKANGSTFIFLQPEDWIKPEAFRVVAGCTRNRKMGESNRGGALSEHSVPPMRSPSGDFFRAETRVSLPSGCIVLEFTSLLCFITTALQESKVQQYCLG